MFTASNLFKGEKMDNTNTCNIVVCDDSATNVLILSQIVKDNCNAKIIEITDPRNLTPILEGADIDLLLLDIEMPYINGFDILKNVRKIHPPESLPIIVISGLQSKESRNKALSLGANDYITKPFDQVEISLRLKSQLKVQSAHKIISNKKLELEGRVNRRTQALESSIDDLINSLAIAGELKDDETGKHLCRVGKYAGILARGYGLPNSIAKMIEKTAPLHDIGKIGVPDSILLKKGKLTDDERKIMQQHTLYGQKIIGNHDNMLLEVAQSVALNHHERWDGTGYPNGLSGETIPIEGRITALADVFDALTIKRSYKEAWPLDKALNKIKNESGKHFDPQLVDALTSNINQFKIVMVELADN